MRNKDEWALGFRSNSLHSEVFEKGAAMLEHSVERSRNTFVGCSDMSIIPVHEHFCYRNICEQEIVRPENRTTVVVLWFVSPSAVRATPKAVDKYNAIRVRLVSERWDA